jgi:type II secretory pathway pseudopilin PulG
MKSDRSTRRKRSRASEDESGFTLVEMVVAIPVTLLILGLLFTSVGVTVGLMGQVTKGAGSARVASSVMDQLSAARNCTDIRAVTSTLTATNYNERYAVSIPSFSCTDNSPVTLSFDVKDREKNATYYSKTVTLAGV